MPLELLLIVFFIFIIINHILTNQLFPKIEYIIEGMTCNPNTQSKKSVCFQNSMKENKTNISSIENTTKSLMKKFSNLKNTFNKNRETITTNKTNMQKIIDVENGKGVDNSDACAKYPDAC